LTSWVTIRFSRSVMFHRVSSSFRITSLVRLSANVGPQYKKRRHLCCMRAVKTKRDVLSETSEFYSNKLTTQLVDQQVFAELRWRCVCCVFLMEVPLTRTVHQKIAVKKSKNTASWTRILVEKLTEAQQVKKSSMFYRTRGYITRFTRIRRWTLSWGSWIKSTSSHTVFFKIHLHKGKRQSCPCA
jgi:hypothetical protein